MRVAVAGELVLISSLFNDNLQELNVNQKRTATRLHELVPFQVTLWIMDSRHLFDAPN